MAPTIPPGLGRVPFKIHQLILRRRFGQGNLTNLAVPFPRWQNTDKPILIAPTCTDSRVDLGLRRRSGLPEEQSHRKQSPAD